MMHPKDKSMIIFRSLALLCLLMSAGEPAIGQYYSTGQEPASIRWKKITTENATIIFPDYYEERARWLAGYLDAASPAVAGSLKHRPKRIPLIMHTQSATANAVVAWAPKRMEFYTTPPQDMYPQPWLEQLVLHEYRHVVQIDKLNQGPVKVLSWLLGQQGTAAILGLYVPPWFLEGDAVATETALSEAGRGRLPLFEMKLRSQLLSEGPCSYDKAVLRSYRDFVPDHYELGYFLVAEGRRKYGADIWAHTLDRVARRPYMVTPFQKGIRDVSGLRKVPFYRDCMESLGKDWQQQDSMTDKTQFQILSPEKRIYANYRHPGFINDTLLVALKVSFDDIPRFVGINPDGKEKRLFTPGFLDMESLSVQAGKICWAERRPDPRWDNRSYTTIRILDHATGKVKNIRHRLRLFAPALSADGARVVAVKVDSLDRYSLVVMDALNGKIMHNIPSPANTFPLTPVWAGDGLVIAVLVSEEGKAIAKFDIASGRSKILTGWDHTDISQPCYSEPYLFFTAAWSGISNIYALNLQEGDIHRLSSARFGATDPVLAADSSSLVYADYDATGFRIVKMPLDSAGWQLIDDIYDRSAGLYRDLVAQEEKVIPGSEVEPTDLPARKYSKLANLFNFHSWAPLDINVSSYDIRPGVSIMSQNLLSSSFLTAGYGYDLNEEAGKVYGTYTYAGWYPVIDLSADYGLRRDYAYLPEQTELKWDETNLRAGVRLPLDLRRGKHFAGIQAGLYANQVLRRMKPGSVVDFRKPDVFSLGYGFTAYRQLRSNFRDIFPRWGQSLGLYYRNTPFGQGAANEIAAAVMNLYFPGILRHQGLNLYAGYQQRLIGFYKFSDIVAYPRGISGRQDEELLSIRSTYAFPIAYPDWSIGPVIYLKRIRGNLFYDYAMGFNDGRDRTYNSMGADVLAEIHLLRFFAPIEIGTRCTYIPDEASVNFSLLFSVGFSSFFVGRQPDNLPVY
jgi:hypothetical protein